MTIVDNVVDWVTKLKLGSAGGIISSGVLFYDRFARNRPRAHLTRHMGEVCVVLKNTADETLIVDEIGVGPNVLGLSVEDAAVQ